MTRKRRPIGLGTAKNQLISSVYSVSSRSCATSNTAVTTVKTNSWPWTRLSRFHEVRRDLPSTSKVCGFTHTLPTQRRPQRQALLQSWPPCDIAAFSCWAPSCGQWPLCQLQSQPPATLQPPTRTVSLAADICPNDSSTRKVTTTYPSITSTMCMRTWTNFRHLAPIVLEKKPAVGEAMPASEPRSRSHDPVIRTRCSSTQEMSFREPCSSRTMEERRSPPR